MGCYVSSCSTEEPPNVDSSSESENEVEQEKNDYINFGDGVSTEYSFAQEGGSISIGFECGDDWTAQPVNNRADGWLTVSPVSGKKGSAQLTITAIGNEDYEERSASVKIKSGETEKMLRFVQKQKDAILLSSSKVDVSCEGGSFELNVESNVGYEIDIECDWIKIPKSKAMVKDVLVFGVDANTTGDKREGIIIITGNGISETVTVYQAAERRLTLTADRFNFSEEGGAFTVDVVTNEDFEIKFPAVDWIVEERSRALSTHTFNYSVLPNNTYESRTADIIYISKNDTLLRDTVSVMQMYKGAIVMAQNNYDIALDGGLVEIELSTNVSLEVSIDVDWITEVVSKSRGLEKMTRTFWVAANDGTGLRKGSITFKEIGGVKQQTVVINQAGVDLQKEALIALYKATGGDNWTRKDNWCSDKPLSEWYGLMCYGPEGKVRYINLPWNNLVGELPDEIFSLTSLDHLNFEGNEIAGELSEKIGNLSNLQFLGLSNNKMSGSIPVSLSQLTKLEYFSFEMNMLTGNVPAELEGMPNWEAVIKDRIEPQLPGYGFTYPSTIQMIPLGDNFYMHPDGYALEYRIDKDRMLSDAEVMALIEKFYTKLNDSFDFVQLVYNVLIPEAIGVGAAASFSTVYDMDIEGLGLGRTNYLHQYGNPKNLRGIVTTYSHNGLWAIYHELCHYWGALDIGQEGIATNGASGREYAHWGVSDVNGVLGGFKASTLERNVDGNSKKYKASSPDGGLYDRFAPISISSNYYAPLELYMMGMIPKNEVGPITVFKDVSGTTADNPLKNGVFYAESEEIVTIDDIINKYGERKPSYLDSKKNFRMATIVISSRQIYDKEWDTIVNCLKIIEAEKGSNGRLSFKEATGGKGSIITTGLNSERK